MNDTPDLKTELCGILREAGAWQAGIVSPEGFVHGLEKRRPLESWPECRSVVVFVTAMSPEMNNTYLGPLAPCEGRRIPAPVPGPVYSERYAMNRLGRMFSNYIQMICMMYLESKGCRTSFHGVQNKVAAAASGLGVYGRSGLIIHPELGSRICIGTVLTDAEMEPDPPLEDFEPCMDCDLCVSSCPAGAFDPSKVYPDSWSRETCTGMRAEIEAGGKYCHNCMAVCPAGTVADGNMWRLVRSVSLLD